MDSSKLKKILIIVSFIAFVLLMGYLLFLTFFNSPPPDLPPDSISTSTPGTGGFPNAGQGSETQTNGNEGTGQLSTEDTKQNDNLYKKAIPSNVAKGGLTKTTELNKNRSLDPVLSSGGTDIQYYNANDGKFYKIDPEGNIEALSDKVFHQVEKTTWSASREKAILEYPDGSNILYNFDTGEQISLPKHWEDFDFSATGDQIVMKSIGLDPENRYLAISNSDGSRAYPVEAIGLNANKVISSWSPNNQAIAMYVEGIDFNRQEVFFIGKNNENFKSTIVEGRGFQPLWSESGDKLLYSVYSSDNEMKPSLWVVDAQGDNIGANRKSIKIETWAEKCTFSGDSTIYCAVPNELEEGAGIFPEIANNTTDKLYRINLNTGAKKIIAIPDKDYNISNIVVTEDQNNLFFIDNKTERIHKIELQ